MMVNEMVKMMTEMLMITSTVTFSYWDDDRFPYQTQKPRNDENIARHLGPTNRWTNTWTDGRMDRQTDG